MDSKTCIGCGESKPIEQYSYKVKAKGSRQSYCKPCEAINNKKYYLANKDKVRELKRLWEKANPDKVRESNRKYNKKYPEKGREKSKRYRENNPDKIKEYSKKYTTENRFDLGLRKRAWEKDNPEKVSIARKKRLAERLQDKEFALRYRLNLNMANSINMSLNGKKSGRSWESLVGYTLEELKRHLEDKFAEGMTWENRSKWHIDHIMPKASFSFTDVDDEFRKCWSLDNLQPLWAEENQRKKDKLPHEWESEIAAL